MIKKIIKRLFEVPAIFGTLSTIFCIVMLFISIDPMKWFIGGIICAIITGILVRVNGNNNNNHYNSSGGIAFT